MSASEAHLLVPGGDRYLLEVWDASQANNRWSPKLDDTVCQANVVVAFVPVDEQNEIASIVNKLQDLVRRKIFLLELQTTRKQHRL